MKNRKRVDPTAVPVAERETGLKRITLALGQIVILAVAVAFVAFASGPAAEDSAPVFVKEIPPGYRDWKLISVAHEEGTLNDIRAILGNDVAIKAYREANLPFPDGAIIARLAWEYLPSEENNEAFGRRQSFVAGQPKNGVQFMVKDSKKYAASGGWGFAHFDDGKPASGAFMQSCFPCHDAVKSRDLVFTRYSP
jgi:Cytochrome P460